MDHTHIVTAHDFDTYSQRRESEAVIPELVYKLVQQSIPPPTICRIPYGDSVNLPGWDGRVQIPESFMEFVPELQSFWEIGTGNDPQKKATEDFSKRTDDLPPEERKNTGYVFVTSRTNWSEPKQTTWLNKRQDKGWREIRIIDGVKLADWLRMYPAHGRWMAKEIGLTGSLGGLTTPREHWELVQSEVPTGDPPLPPKLFLEGRANAVEALKRLFDGGLPSLLLFAESPLDVVDFISAYLASLDEEIAMHLAGRCLYVADEEAWHSVSNTRVEHILVADPRLGLESDDRANLRSLARKNGHSIIVPLCGAWSQRNPEIIRLNSPSQHQIKTVLSAASYKQGRAQELARIGGGDYRRCADTLAG